VDYKNLYNDDFFNKSDGIDQWRNNILKFGDAFAALCYAHDINYYEDILKHFPDISDIYGRFKNGNYTIYDQINFLQNNKKRTPKNILEIGGGRGELACTLGYMNINITSIEVSKNAYEWYWKTAQKYFNDKINLNKINLINDSITNVNLNLSQYDTIIMVESLEHILEEDFKPFLNNMINNFKGYFIVTNWLNHQYHPIKKSGDIHCRDVDDNLYDYFETLGIKKFRKLSHLCVDINGKTTLETN